MVCSWIDGRRDLGYDDVSEAELFVAGRCPGRRTEQGNKAAKRTSNKWSARSDLALAMMGRGLFVVFCENAICVQSLGTILL